MGHERDEAPESQRGPCPRARAQRARRRRADPPTPNFCTTGTRSTVNAAVGPGDLPTRATEKRAHEARDDGRVEAVLRRRARSDRERHRQRQRDDADDHEAGQARPRVDRLARSPRPSVCRIAVPSEARPGGQRVEIATRRHRGRQPMPAAPIARKRRAWLWVRPCRRNSSDQPIDAPRSACASRSHGSKRPTARDVYFQLLGQPLRRRPVLGDTPSRSPWAR